MRARKYSPMYSQLPRKLWWVVRFTLRPLCPQGNIPHYSWTGWDAKTPAPVGNPIPIPISSSLYPAHYFCCRLPRGLSWHVITSCVRSTATILVTDRQRCNWEWITCWKDKFLDTPPPFISSTGTWQTAFKQWSLAFTVTRISHQSVFFVSVCFFSYHREIYLHGVFIS